MMTLTITHFDWQDHDPVNVLKQRIMEYKRRQDIAIQYIPWMETFTITMTDQQALLFGLEFPEYADQFRRQDESR